MRDKDVTAMEQWNLARVRRGEYFDPPGDDDLPLTQADANR
jgi:hypothetical protein